ncbi:TRAP transporter small permease subunit [Desulfatirhabdium butyrativorans]|uniref:TRAP transporter small permease subunit n=1 Tax=Desulfatirhabdium butyrativorans TaxID=340467 RepID=UPI000428B058|nr:TRAP transporter small permease subunit [Desulfatirhabdium butyrativorans]
MTFLLKISGLIDGLSRRIGQFIIWLILASVLLSTGNALARKLFRIGSNAFTEMQWYLYGAVFLLGAGYAFLKNAHVRIDFVSSRLSPRTRTWIDIFGILFFLAPLCFLLIDLSWSLFVNAFQSGEMSQSAGGLIRWPVYLLLPTGISLLLLQSFSELIKRIAFLKHMGPDPLAPKTDDKEPARSENETSRPEEC